MASERLTANDIFGDEPPDTIVLPGEDGMLLLGHIGHAEVRRRLAAGGWPGSVNPDGIDHAWVVFDRHGEDCAARPADQAGCICRNQAGRRAALAWYVHRSDATATGATAVTFVAWHPPVQSTVAPARRPAPSCAAPAKAAAGVE
jgi:hypothetical protein